MDKISKNSSKQLILLFYSCQHFNSRELKMAIIKGDKLCSTSQHTLKNISNLDNLNKTNSKSLLLVICYNKCFGVK